MADVSTNALVFLKTPLRFPDGRMVMQLTAQLSEDDQSPIRGALKMTATGIDYNDVSLAIPYENIAGIFYETVDGAIATQIAAINEECIGLLDSLI